MGMGFRSCRWWVRVERCPKASTQAGCIEALCLELLECKPSYRLNALTKNAAICARVTESAGQ